MERDNKRINSMLSVMPDGDYKCGFLKGWVHVNSRALYKTVAWTSGSASNFPLMGPRKDVDFWCSEIRNVFDSSAMFMRTDKSLWLDHAQYIEDKVWLAFKRNNLDKVGI